MQKETVVSLYSSEPILDHCEETLHFHACQAPNPRGGACAQHPRRAGGHPPPSLRRVPRAQAGPQDYFPLLFGLFSAAKARQTLLEMEALILVSRILRPTRPALDRGSSEGRSTIGDLSSLSRSNPGSVRRLSLRNPMAPCWSS